MSLLIKALQKAEQSKDAKTGDKKVAKTGLELELAPQETKAEISNQLESVTPEQQNSENASLSFSGNEIPDSTIDAINHLEPEPSLIDELGFNLADEAGFVEPLETKKTAESQKNIQAAQIDNSFSAPDTEPAEPIAAPPVVAIPANNPTPEPSSQREAAASLLSLQKEEKRKPQNTNKRSFYMGAIALVMLLLLGGGFYYYLETLEQPQLIALTPPPVQVSPVAAPATPVVADPAETPVEPEPTEPVAVLPEEDAMPLAATGEEQKAKPPVTAKANSISEVTDPKSVSTAESPKKSQAASSGESPMKVARMRKSELATNPTQVAAYQAFLAGDDQAAGRLYRQLLQSDPRNVDALLGLAAVASRQDKVDEAVRTYQHALELDPRNSIAQAGLITMLGQTNPGEAESRLKNLLAQQPDAAYLHAALGNTYSELNRWPEAQQSYFQAFSMDSANADYAFNLAVSLDQMGKYELALDYYQRAASLLAKQGGSVDKAALDNRLDQLRSLLAK